MVRSGKGAPLSLWPSTGSSNKILVNINNDDEQLGPRNHQLSANDSTSHASDDYLTHITKKTYTI